MIARLMMLISVLVVAWVLQMSGALAGRADYVRVAARVDSVVRSCQPRGVPIDAFVQSTDPRHREACHDRPGAFQRVKSEVRVRYVSPIDKQEHKAAVQLFDPDRELTPPAKGSIWEIEASTRIATKARVPR